MQWTRAPFMWLGNPNLAPQDGRGFVASLDTPETAHVSPYYGRGSHFGFRPRFVDTHGGCSRFCFHPCVGNPSHGKGCVTNLH